MSKKVKWVIIGSLCLAVVIGGVIAGVVFTSHRLPPVGTKVGNRAPDFTLNDFSGKPVRLSQFRGHVVLLEFWQSTCPDCRRETPYLGELYSRYKAEGLVWVGVNLDHDHEAAEKFLEENGLTDEQVVLGNDFSAAMEVVDLFAVPLVPCVFVIDKHGIIRYRGVYPAKPVSGDIEPWL